MERKKVRGKMEPLSFYPVINSELKLLCRSFTSHPVCQFIQGTCKPKVSLLRAFFPQILLSFETSSILHSHLKKVFVKSPEINRIELKQECLLVLIMTFVRLKTLFPFIIIMVLPDIGACIDHIWIGDLNVEGSLFQH